MPNPRKPKKTRPSTPPRKPAGFSPRRQAPLRKLTQPAEQWPMRLNKYIAHCGICSRRQAAEYVKEGLVAVNGKVVTEPGVEVQPDDRITYKGQLVRPEDRKVYILMNKPKNVITTSDDEKGRKTVLDLLKGKIKERVYPVGRLDRDTTGLLLLTNDGDLAKKLTHPSHGAQKLYHATLDRNLTGEELHRLVEGVMLEDGPAKADEASFVGASKREVGLLIHMGRNRIVRRMFQALGAEVVKLDRVMFAGLTKKDLSRGRWRHLEEKEVVWLKQLKAAPADTGAERGGRRTRLSQGSE